MTNERLMMLAFNQFSESLVITDADKQAGYRVIMVNDAFCKLTGYSRKEIIGKSLKVLQGPRTETEIIDKLRQCISDGKVFEGSTINYRKDGTPYRVFWNVSPVIDNGVVTHYISLQKDITEQSIKDEKLFIAANFDKMTRVFNRNFGDRYFQEVYNEARFTNSPLSILLCDVDHFKRVNDRFGHLVGDKVLQKVATSLKKSIRTNDIVIRWGGEEFLIVLKNCGSVPAEQLASRVTTNIREQQFPVGTVTLSIGVATLGGEPLDDFFNRADVAMYLAKASGRDRFMVSKPADN